MILGCSSFKFVKINKFHAELWSPLQPKGNTLKNFLSEKERIKAICLMCSSPMIHYEDGSIEAPGVKIGPSPEATCFTKLKGQELRDLVCSIFTWSSTKIIHVISLG